MSHIELFIKNKTMSILWIIFILISIVQSQNDLTIANPNVTEVHCPSDGDCTIYCTKSSGCSYTTIYCNNNDPINNYQCNILCYLSSNSSCSNLNVIALDTTHVSIVCIGRYQCESLTAIIILHDTPNVTAQILCQGNYSCDSSSIIIDTNSETNLINNFDPSSGNIKRNIELDCQSNYACYNLHFMVSAIDYIKLFCHGYYSCESVDIIYGTIEPFPSGILEIDCYGGEEACGHMDIVALTAKQLKIICGESTESYNAEQCKWMKVC